MLETVEITDVVPPKPVECRQHGEERWLILPIPWKFEDNYGVYDKLLNSINVV